jgi:hypothetical protein
MRTSSCAGRRLNWCLNVACARRRRTATLSTSERCSNERRRITNTSSSNSWSCSSHARCSSGTAPRCSRRTRQPTNPVRYLPLTCECIFTVLALSMGWLSYNRRRDARVLHGRLSRSSSTILEKCMRFDRTRSGMVTSDRIELEACR